MLRLPHTSINLSEHDLAFHLQQIDIYHGLLKQGFKKKDILRYFKEHREANAAGSEDSEPELINAPSTVELAARSPPPAEVFDPLHHQSTSDSLSDEQQEVQEPHDIVKQEHDTDELAKTTNSSPTVAVPPNHRHAPRQSSLLRFAQAVSPDSTQSDETEKFPTYPVLPARSYRPRTDTYSYNQSEASESDLASQFSSLRISPTAQDNDPAAPQHRPRSSLSMRPDAASFVPDEVITPRRSSLRATNIGTTRHADSSSPRGEFPSSPPLPVVEDSVRIVSSPSLPSMPATPTPARGGQRSVRTEPRNHGPQYLDGPFPVYNDSLPASTQPQTPADLTRRQLITEHEAAYTAPVGMIRTPTASRFQRAARPDQAEAGEQSPTRRAMGMRERRARELLRGARVEGVRLERQRRQDRELMTRADRTNEQRGRETAGRDGPGPATFTEQWEDQLEGDRVGDENWEGELEGPVDGIARRGIRVVSGNANAGRGWLDGTT